MSEIFTQAGLLNNDFRTCLYHLNRHGLEAHPRGTTTKELLNYNITLMNPRNRIITFPARKTNLKYLLGEFVWYLSGVRTVEEILPYSKFWAQITNTNGPSKEHYPEGTINSNYGTRMFGHDDRTMVDRGFDEACSQWGAVSDILRKDPDSRQAIINIHLPEDRWSGNKDVPCTLSLQFFIREDKLHMIVNMRSNDIILGFTNDVFQFTMFQEAMMCELRNRYPTLELGYYYHNAGSMHIYDRHFDMMNAIIGDDRAVDAAMIPMDKFDSSIMLGLYTMEKIWREDGMKVDFKPEEIGAWALLTPYWQDLFRMCFLGDEEAFQRIHGDND